MGQDFCNCSPFHEGEKEESNTEPQTRKPIGTMSSHQSSSSSSSNSSSRTSSSDYSSRTDDESISIPKPRLNQQATDPNTPTEISKIEAIEEIINNNKDIADKLDDEINDEEIASNDHIKNTEMTEASMDTQNYEINDQLSDASKSPELSATKPIQTSPVNSIKSLEDINSDKSSKNSDDVPLGEFQDLPNPPSPILIDHGTNPSHSHSGSSSPNSSNPPSPDFSPSPSPTSRDHEAPIYYPPISPPLTYYDSAPNMTAIMEEGRKQRSVSMAAPPMIDVDGGIGIPKGRPRSASTPASEPPETPTLKRKITKKRLVIDGFLRIYKKDIKEIMDKYTVKIDTINDDANEDIKHDVIDYDQENSRILAEIAKIVFFYYDILTQPDEQVRILRNADYQSKSLEILLDQGSHNFMSLVKKWSTGKKGDAIWNKLWTKLDKHNRAYIETHKEVYRGIAMLLVIQKAISHKKKAKGGSNKFAYDKTMMEYTKHIGTWIVMKYGRRLQDQLMTFIMTKQEFRTKLSKWLQEYKEMNKKSRLDNNEMIADSNWDITDDRELQIYLGVIIRPKYRFSVTDTERGTTNALYLGK